jgi:hypothetical protein
LICYADCGEVTRRYRSPGKRKSTCLKNGSPDIFGIVLNPAGAGKVLREFLLPDAEDIELSIEHDRSRRRRALVNGENVGTHGVEPPSLPPHPQLSRTRVAAWQEAHSRSW